MAALKETTAPQVTLASEASANGHAVRKQEFDAALAGKAAASHSHGTGDITGFTESVQDVVGALVAQSTTITPAYNDAAGELSLAVRFGDGLTVDAEGLAVSFGDSHDQAARGDHTHDQLHAAVVKTDTDTVAITLTGQNISAAVRMAASPGAGYGKVVSDSNGIKVVLGTAGDTAAAGDHTHAQLHAAVTKGDTATVAITLTGQNITAAVRMAATPGTGYGKVASDSNGIKVVLGTAADVAAAGNHTHGLATQSADGFLGAADKRKLDAYQTLHQVEFPVSFHRHDAIAIGEYVGGKKRFGQSMQIVRLNATAQGPTGSTVRLVLEVDGVAQADTITIPTGSGEVSATVAPTNLFVAADAMVRWKCDQGFASNGALENSASRIDLEMNVRPALGSVPVYQINCGGGAVSPFATDQLYDGGSTGSTATVIDTSGVTSPAPASVYQTARTKYNGTNYPLTYDLTGLGRGVDYKVRLHFAEIYWNTAGDQVFDIEVTGATTGSASNYDIIAQAGAKHKAVVREFTLKADSNGKIRVRLLPKQGSGGLYHCAINAIEAIES